MDSDNKRIALPWHVVAQMLVASHRLTMLVGEPGTGKSTWASGMAKATTGQEPEVVQGTPDTEINHIFGFFALTKGETSFCDGPLPRALKHGRYLVIEEFNLMPLETTACLLTLRGNASITNPFTGEVLTVSDRFRLIATSNPDSLKNRRNNKIAQVLLDDFLILEVPRLTGEQIKDMLAANYPQAGQELLARVCKLWEEYQDISKTSEQDKKERIRLSYRAADHLTKLCLAGMKEEWAVQAALVNKYIVDQDAHDAAKLRSSLG